MLLCTVCINGKTSLAVLVVIYMEVFSKWPMMMRQKTRWKPRWSSWATGWSLSWSHQGSMSYRRAGRGPRLGRKGRSWLAPIAGCMSQRGRRGWRGHRTGRPGARTGTRGAHQLASSSSCRLWKEELIRKV